MARERPKVLAVACLVLMLAALALAGPAQADSTGTLALEIGGQPGSGAAPSPGKQVFPVVGGPDLVSVALEHNDYPAADIAAPAGTPVVAQADATVLETYPFPAGRCGIGLKLRTATGVYVYCHFSRLEPGLEPGATLVAGAPVGLVGSTGNSTGPHLHLQRVPAVAYPQQEPWFAGLGGSAFRWREAFVPKALGPSEAPSAEASGNGPTAGLALRLPGAAPAAFPPVGIPVEQWLVPIWQEAGEAYGIPWEILAAINKIESDNGRFMGPSSAGAIGWMQFLPSTWAQWGVDADSDGIANPWKPHDAIHSAARYLVAAGAHQDLPSAIFAYNHAWWYVDDVLELARRYGWR